MKRRTNLFYTNLETNFLTFSNYAEHMTGAFLATNIKMFPSKFICMNIPSLSSKEDVQNFIKNYLIAYYENKLACLRDCIINNPDGIEVVHPDKKLNYLGYLIDTIKKYDENASVVYVSDVTEQDYNGTFTDIICTIDSSLDFIKEWKIDEDKDTSNECLEAYDLDAKYLYGWATDKEDALYFGPAEFKTSADFKPKFDEEKMVDVDPFEGQEEKDDYPNGYLDVTYEDPSNPQINVGVYYVNSFASSIHESGKPSSNTIEFNVIIPLYDIANIETSEPDNEYEESEQTIDLHAIPVNDYVKNVPYGIWFANDTVSLTRDNYTKYAPSWSLMIGTQFKPFPNSSYLFSDVSSGSSIAPFATMAQIMQKQSYIYESLENNMASLDTIKESVEKNVNAITYNLTYITSLLDSVNMQSTENITYLIDQRIKEISNSTSIISYNINWQIKK